MGLDPFTAGFELLKAGINKAFPDKTEAARITAQLEQSKQDGDLKALEIGMSAIIMEAKSQDPWTSRARPSFMYVMYFMILMAVPIGILSAFKPLLTKAIIEGVKLWFEALPGELYALFCAGYLGYGTMREIGKKNVLQAKESAFNGLAKLFR
ncbi:hypothetical protein H8E88_19245 [candidate division KSB1 bacterium]|nr:hypothetical protein [candidate division KSB1 bacterium]